MTSKSSDLSSKVKSPPARDRVWRSRRKLPTTDPPDLDTRFDSLTVIRSIPHWLDLSLFIFKSEISNMKFPISQQDVSPHGTGEHSGNDSRNRPIRPSGPIFPETKVRRSLRKTPRDASLQISGPPARAKLFLHNAMTMPKGNDR